MTVHGSGSLRIRLWFLAENKVSLRAEQCWQGGESRSGRKMRLHTNSESLHGAFFKKGPSSASLIITSTTLMLASTSSPLQKAHSACTPSTPIQRNVQTCDRNGNTTFLTCVLFPVRALPLLWGLSSRNLPNEKVALACHRGTFGKHIRAPVRGPWVLLQIWTVLFNFPDCSDAVKKPHNSPSS